MERPQTITDPLTRTTTTIYNADGIATTVAAPMNRVTTTTYVLQPGQPRLVTTTNPLTHATISQYDAAGQHRFLTNRNGQDFEMNYDALGRLTQTLQPGGRAHGIAYVWNSTGLRQTITEPSTQTAILQHDARGRLITKTVPDATTSYGYDASGNLLTVTEGAAVLTRTYEADRDLVNSYTNAAGEVIGYAHDANGNLTTLTYPGGRQVHYAYDKRDQLVSVTDWEQRRTTFQYDLSGRLISVRRPNGTTRLLAYDAAGQMLALREVGPGGALIATQGWRYDAGGRPTARVRQPQPAAFSSPAFSATYHDDNRLNTLTPNGGSAVTVSSDLDGNILSTPLWEPTQTWQRASFTWDARNRLLSAATANGSAAYTYDAEGHLIERTANAQPTRFTVNPNTSLSQVLIAHHSDHSKTFYVYGATGLLYEETFDATHTSQGTRSYHADQVGSTIALTDDAGQVTGRLEYTAHGLTSHTSGNVDTPFRYNAAYGVMTDPATGLLHMRARWYSPSLGRFLSEDPIGFGGGMNWYGYADGDPLTSVDPLGLWTDNPGDNFYAQLAGLPVQTAPFFTDNLQYFAPKKDAVLHQHDYLEGRFPNLMQTARTYFQSKTQGLIRGSGQLNPNVNQVNVATPHWGINANLNNEPANIRYNHTNPQGQRVYKVQDNAFGDRAQNRVEYHNRLGSFYMGVKTPISVTYDAKQKAYHWSATMYVGDTPGHDGTNGTAVQRAIHRAQYTIQGTIRK